MIVHLEDEGIWVNTDHVVQITNAFREVFLTNGFRYVLTQQSFNKLTGTMTALLFIPENPNEPPKLL